MRRMHRLHIRQWCARGGLYVSQRVHTVHSPWPWPFFCPECKSEKSNRFCGNGTVPGSERTAFKCAIVNRKTTVLNETTCRGAHKLKQRKVPLFIYTWPGNCVEWGCPPPQDIPCLHCLQDNPSRHHIIGIEHSSISHQQTDDSARITNESHVVRYGNELKRTWFVTRNALVLISIRKFMGFTRLNFQRTT